MRVNFYINKANQDDRGLVPINLFISVNSKRYKFYTGLKCEPDSWEAPEFNKVTKTKILGHVKGKDGKQINNALQSMEVEARQVYNSAIERRAKITRNFFIKELSFIRESEGDFFEVWEKYIEHGQTQKNWTEGFVRRLNTLKVELDKLNKKYKIDFETINDDFLNRFLEQHYEQGWTNPYTEKNYKLLKTFLTWATKKGHNKNLDFQGFEVSLPKPGENDNIYALTLDELNAVMSLKMANEGLEKVRDCFLLQCFTGLRYSDVENLKKSDINHENIHVTTQKTKKTIRIPLNDVSRAILGKYSEVETLNDKAIPTISNQKFNPQLRNLGKLAKLNEKVKYINYVGSKTAESTHPKWAKMSSHTGRKTFITNGVYLGISIETMIEYTGQSIKIVKRYYNVPDEVRNREMAKFNQLPKMKIVS